MRRYTNHKEIWGEFVDVKINATEVLAKEVKKKKKGEVFLSSVCDGWQPLEAKHKLTRKCLQILLKNGFPVNILTKSALVERDFDLLKANPKTTELGFTITTLDERLQRLIEPRASSSLTRLSLLKKATDLGIRVYAFLGPLLPYLSDRELDLERLFDSLSHIELDYIYIDRLNPRFGVWQRLYPILKRHYPKLWPEYKEILFNKSASEIYSHSLSNRTQKVAKKYGLQQKLNLCF